jgi:hypothetical protein
LGGESVSIAVFVTIKVVNSATVRLLCDGSTGAVLAGVTTTTKLFVALNDGEPLSLTTVIIVFVLGAWPADGVHVIMPFELMPAPTGGDNNW